MTIGLCWQRGLKKLMALVVVELVAETFAVSAAASAQAGAATPQPADAVPATFVSNHDQLDPDGFLTRGGTIFRGSQQGEILGAMSCRRSPWLFSNLPPIPKRCWNNLVPNPAWP